MVEKMLPLLSDGLRKIVENIREKHSNCDIAQELLLADDLIIGYNELCRSCWIQSKETSVMKVIREKVETLINDEARMLSFRYNAFEISYLPKGKQAIYTGENTWGRENRQTAKPARLIQKILIREFKCKEFEDFSNWIKNEIVEAGDFVLVSGSDITKYYNEETYVEIKGTLGNSCMRHSDCEQFFKVYEDNAKLLICKKDDKILGRAIVWELPEGVFMDRIYTCYDYLINQFIDYAQTQKWHYRQDNSLLNNDEYQEWYGPEDDYTNCDQFDLTIQLDRVYDYMPYLDSFRYYNSTKNSIHTNPNRGDYYLSNTDGSYMDEEPCTYTCECCGTTARTYYDELPEGWVYSEWEDGYFCEDCAVYCNGLDDYISKNTETVSVIEESLERRTYPESYVENNSDFCIIDDQWYSIYCNLVEYDGNSYILKKDE